MKEEEFCFEPFGRNRKARFVFKPGKEGRKDWQDPSP